MHKLIEQAKGRVDQAELYWIRNHEITVTYENYRLQQINENDLSSVALRVILDGRMGSAYGITPDQETLLDDARTSASFGDKATFGFAPAAPYEAVDNYDPACAALTSEQLVEACESVKGRIQRELPDVALRMSCAAETQRLAIATTEGADAETKSTTNYIYFSAPFKGAGMGVGKFAYAMSPTTVEDELVDEFVEWYRWGDKLSTPSTGRLPAIITPQAAFLLGIPLQFGLSGDAVHKKTSPLIGRLGEQILSEKLTILDDALRLGDPLSRPFDDEGVPTRRRPLVDRGVAVEYLLDQRTAAALSSKSTGNGMKSALFGGDTETPPSPWAVRLVIEPGHVSYREMIAGMDEGLLITSGMGFHSGNYPQGQFSVQAVGYHIVGGRVIGRLAKTMVSGNIYEDFKRIGAVSRELLPSVGGLLSSGLAPYVLVDSLQIAGK